MGYKMESRRFFRMVLFDAAVLDLSDSAILTKFQNAIKVQASMSLGLGIPTAASAPHSILSGFKSLVAVSAATEYSFPQAEVVLSAAKNAPAAAATTTAAPIDEGPKEVEEKEEIDMGGAADLFGGGD